MNELTYDDRRLCELQARVFEESLHVCDSGSAVFVRRFMRSDLARRLDEAGATLERSDPEQMVREVDAEYGEKTYGSEKYSASEMHWMGYIYRCWCCCTGESSKVVYKTIGARELRSIFYTYHSLDPVLAIERIRDSKGIDDVDEVRRGIELLKKMRSVG